jgi:hypothetical protein
MTRTRPLTDRGPKGFVDKSETRRSHASTGGGQRLRRPPLVPAVKQATRRSTLVLLPLLCAAALTLASCSSGSSSTIPPPTAARPAPADAAGQALSAYRIMWADLVTAAQTSDFQSTLLAQHATGEALTLLVQGLARDQFHGIVTRGTTVHHPQVTSLTPAANPTGATIGDCFDDTHWVEYNTSGGLAKNAPGGRRATTAALVRSGRTWKVSQITVQATGTC